MNDQQKLLPCPFCGSTNCSLVDPDELTEKYVMCLSCFAQIDQGYKTAPEAVQAWNTRAPADGDRRDATLRTVADAVNQLWMDSGRENRDAVFAIQTVEKVLHKQLDAIRAAMKGEKT